jgi:hypothetical protein
MMKISLKALFAELRNANGKEEERRKRCNDKPAVILNLFYCVAFRFASGQDDSCYAPTMLCKKTITPNSTPASNRESIVKSILGRSPDL